MMTPYLSGQEGGNHDDPIFVRTGGGNHYDVVFMPPLQLGCDKATVIHKVPYVCDTTMH